MLKFLLPALLISTTALAQELPAPIASTPKEFTLHVTAADLQLLQAALDELPRKFSQPLIEKLQKQIIEQVKPQEEPKK